MLAILSISPQSIYVVIEEVLVDQEIFGCKRSHKQTYTWRSADMNMWNAWVFWSINFLYAKKSYNTLRLPLLLQHNDVSREEGRRRKYFDYLTTKN